MFFVATFMSFVTFVVKLSHNGNRRFHHRGH